jgi:hypothetical protein
MPLVRRPDTIIDLRDTPRVDAPTVESAGLIDHLRRARVIAAVLLVILNIADLVTTRMFLDRGLEEGNPISAVLLSNGSMPFVKTLLLLGIAWSAVRAAPRVSTTVAMWFVVGLYTTVIGVNLLALQSLT